MHWKNSNFQIRQFIANSCHTADEAYRQLKQLYEDRDVAIRNAEASQLRAQAKRLRAEHIIATSDTAADVLEAKADLAEQEAFEEQSRAVLEQAIRERNYIKSLMDELQSQRKYAHLPDEEAFQLAQEEEWELELMWRAENFLATQGSIPHDHFATMRLHPAWESKLLPHVKQVIVSVQGNDVKLTQHQPQFKLEHKEE